MKIHCLARASDFRGDHSADVAVAFEVSPSDTIEELFKRVMHWRYKPDVVELRIAREPVEEAKL